MAKDIEKALHDGRVVRAAERLEPGCLRRIIDRAIARGEEPSHELLHRRLARLLRRHNFDVDFVRI